MLQPSSASTPSLPASPAPAATETVTRPDAGLARGAWEAPAWAFWAALAGVVVFTTLFLLGRRGLLKRRTARGPQA